ncbi:PA14 domain-containing protein [Thermogladius sp. KZ2Tp1]|uniref:PA14 domain-containing protein n=1 Tax=Thermogladius sp. KZ2Tp1 TaxID=3136289 RepID=UPI003DA9ECC7
MGLEGLIKVKKRGLIPGLKAFFYTWSGEAPPQDTSGLTPVAAAVHSGVDFTWWDSPTRGVPPEFFMVEWRGFLRVDEPGSYRFYVVTDDGSRLYLDGKLLIDAWRDQPPTLYMSEEVYLRRGFYKLRLLFYCRYRFSQIRLGWIAGGRTEVLSSDRLYHAISDKAFIEAGAPGLAVEAVSLDGERTVCEVLPCALKLPSADDYVHVKIRVFRGGDLVYDTGEYLTLFGGDRVEVEA